MQADCIMRQYSYVVNKSPTRANLDLMSGPQADASVSSHLKSCLLYTSPSPRDLSTSRMPSSA